MFPGSNHTGYVASAGLVLSLGVLAGCGVDTSESVDEPRSPEEVSASAESNEANLGNAKDAQSATGLFPFVGSWVPAGTLAADGSVLPINAANSVIYTLLGNRYGGDNKTTFGIPAMKEIKTLPTNSESNPPPIKWLMSTGGTFTLNALAAPVVDGEVAFIGSSRPMTVTGATPNPQLARQAGARTQAFINNQGPSRNSYDRFTGQLVLFADGKIPSDDYLALDGRLLSVTENTVLYTILGTNFGGDGKNSFALPKVADWGTAKWAIVKNGSFPSRP